MNFVILGFLTGLSLILAIGTQNLFVVEQGLKKNYTFTVCLICSISDFILIFLGIFLFESFKIYFTTSVELFFNIILFIFLIYFIFTKIKFDYKDFEFNKNIKQSSLKEVIFKTLGFTYLNPHVYSDTVFFIGNFSKNFQILDKYYFAAGASLSSLIFFFTIGYLSEFFSSHVKNFKIWKLINSFIILFMGSLAIFVLIDIFTIN